jgi:hypothetical protein
MTTAYTSLLGLALPVTGELSGTWGDTVNTAITSLLDTAIAGTTSITTDADVTLTTTTGASNQARQAIILWNPASGTTTRNITAPAQSKIYTVINASGGTQSIVIRGAGPTTGVTVLKGESAVVAWNGSDFVKVSSIGGAGTFTNLTVTGNLTVNSLTTTRVPYASTSGLLVDSANMTFNGTRLTVADLADSGLTAGRVVYVGSGSALVDSAALTFDGSALSVSASLASATLASSGAFSALFFTNSGGAAASGTILTNSSGILQSRAATHAYTNADASSEYMRLNSTGLGIGISPAAKLDVSASSGTLMRVEMSGVAQLNIGNGGNSINYYDANTQIWRLGNASEQMRLTSTGLGIGTSSPGEKLDVVGTARVLLNTGATNTGDQNAVVVGATTTGAYAASYGAGLQFQITNSSGGYSGSRIVSRLNADNNTAKLVFQARAYGFSDSMTLTEAGQLLIGTTSSSVTSSLLQVKTNPSSTTAIDVIGTDGTSGNGGSLGMFADTVYLSSNWYYAGGQLKRVAGNGSASINLSGGTSDANTYITFGVGTTGSTSPTERARIHADGNVSVGSTSSLGRFYSYNNSAIQNSQVSYGSSGTFQTGNGTLTLGGGSNPRGIGVVINANRDVGTTLTYGNNYETFGLIAVANVGTGGGYGTTGIAGYAESDGGVYGLRADAKTTAVGGASIAVGLYVGSVTGSSTNYGIYVNDTSATNYFGGSVSIGAVLQANYGPLQVSQPSTSTASSLGFTGTDNAVISSKYSLVFQVDSATGQSGRTYAWKHNGKGYGDGNDLMVLTADTNRLGIAKTSPNSVLDAYGCYEAQNAQLTSGSTVDIPINAGTGNAVLFLVLIASNANSNANSSALLLVNTRSWAYGGGNNPALVSSTQGSTGTSNEPGSQSYTLSGSGSNVFLRVGATAASGSSFTVSTRMISVV